MMIRSIMVSPNRVASDEWYRWVAYMIYLIGRCLLTSAAVPACPQAPSPLLSFTRYRTGLMCSIHIDESAIHVSIAARPSHLLLCFTWCRTGLMMCSIYIDESAIHMSIAARLSCLLLCFTQCCTRLMMCSIHIDDSAIHVLIVARPSCLCVPFSEKLDSLLDCLDNRHTVHDSQNGALEWAHENQNDAQYYSRTTLHKL
jgi:hypothetical protein